MTSPLSTSIINKFDSYNDYLLSKNICLFLQKEKGIEQISKPSLLLLTKTVSNYIEELVYKIRNTTELGSKEETNIIDVLNTFLLKNRKHQKQITEYINKKIDEEKNQNKNYNINSFINVQKLNEKEENTRTKYLKELNSIYVPQSNCINKTLLNSIPTNLRYFPREFTLKHSDNILNKTEETIKEKNEIKKLEKKSLEQIISGHEYYEVDQRNQNDKEYINMLKLYNEIVKKLEHNFSSNDYTSNKDELFGQRFFMRSFQDEHKDSEIENKISGDNDVHMNDNENDNEL